MCGLLYYIISRPSNVNDTRATSSYVRAPTDDLRHSLTSASPAEKGRRHVLGLLAGVVTCVATGIGSNEQIDDALVSKLSSNVQRSAAAL